MKVSPLLPLQDLSHPSHNSHNSHSSHPSHSSPPPPKYAWSVFYPMQAFSEKVEKNTNEENKNDTVKNYKKVRLGWQ